MAEVLLGAGVSDSLILVLVHLISTPSFETGVRAASVSRDVIKK